MLSAFLSSTHHSNRLRLQEHKICSNAGSVNLIRSEVPGSRRYSQTFINHNKSINSWQWLPAKYRIYPGKNKVQFGLWYSANSFGEKGFV
jgi:hypothetical protein